MQADRPNILVIQADQLAATAIGAYHNPIAQTPHTDALAAGGAIFDSAYTNFPLCAPSRFSMMSGQLASTIGAFDNGAEFPSSIPTFAHYLRNLDYQTCLVGKMHFVGADQLHGFEQLFDLQQDPHEQTNQIDNPEYGASREQLSKLVQRHWDVETLSRDIVASQRRRLFLRAALAKGKPQDWDFTATDELEAHCLRADKVYSKWACEGILGYRFPED